MLIVYHHCALNDDSIEDHWIVVDENVVVVVVEMDDLKAMDDDRWDDWNTMNVVEVIVVENVLVVVKFEDDDDETYDEMDEQDDVEKPKVSIELLLSLMNNGMMFEAKDKSIIHREDDQVSTFCLHMFI